MTDRQQWIEVEDGFVTNQPLIYVGRERVPDPDHPPTEIYLFTYECTRTKRGVKRRRRLHLLQADTKEKLGELLVEYVKREDVVLIESQDHPLEYISSRANPKPVEKPEGAGDRGGITCDWRKPTE